MKAKCLITHIVESEGKCIETGEKFIKKFIIEEGMTGEATTENFKHRVMIRLDNTITACNENEAPYKSVMHRTFIPIDCPLGKWEFTD